MKLNQGSSGSARFLSLLDKPLLGYIGEAAHGRHLTSLSRVIGKVEIAVPSGQVFKVLELLIRNGLGAPVAGGTLNAAIQLHCSIHSR